MKAMERMERCQAFENGKSCRCSKNLTRTQISIYRSKTFAAKLPEGAIILLCPKHLRLSPLEHLIASIL